MDPELVTPEETQETTGESVISENTPETTVNNEEAEAAELNNVVAVDLEVKNRQLFERAKKAETEAKAAKLEIERLKKASGTSLDVDDFIDISASLEGLDQRQKGYLAEQHKLTGHSLKDLRAGENFLLWNEGYQKKVEKERALKPSNDQMAEQRPETIQDKLKKLQQSPMRNFKATLAEQEKLLTEQGLYKAPRQPQRQNIGIK